MFRLVGIDDDRAEEPLGECDFIEVDPIATSFWLKNPDGVSISEQWAAAEGEADIDGKVSIHFYDTSWLNGQLERGNKYYERIDIVQV